VRMTPTVKLPVRTDKQCQLLLRNGPKCSNLAWSVMTHADGSTMRLCAKHSRKMKDQINAHPDRFNAVRFSLINK